MENRPAIGDARIGGVASDNANEDEKVYYGFGVFMGMPLAALKAMKDDFVEQQALSGGLPRGALLSSAATNGCSHHVEDEANSCDVQVSVPMASLLVQQQQQQQQPRVDSYEAIGSQQREYEDEPSTGYDQDLHNNDRGGGDADNSDGSDELGNKSHSLNFILH